MARCFISIDLPKEVQNHLKEIQKQILSDNVKLINVKPENIHLTLKFLGEIDEKQLETLKDALMKVRFPRFKAKLSSAGVFPNENFIRVVWIGIEPREKADELHSLLDGQLAKEGFAKDERFENHATISRVKSIKDKRAFVEELKKIKIKQMEFEISKIALKKSTLTPEGPIYEDLMEVKLE